MPNLTPLTSITDADIDIARIAYAVAKNECGERLPLKDVLLREGLNVAIPAVRNVLRSDLFRMRYGAYVRELKDSGESFRLKARVQAEELLATAWEIVQDREAPAATRMKGIENVVEWAGLNAKKTEGQAPAAPAITINIDLGGERPETIDVTPTQPALEASP